VVTFLEEEPGHPVLDVMQWWTERPGLAEARPLRPANYQPVAVDEEVLSRIGLSSGGEPAAARGISPPRAAGRTRAS
jgi:hypothetical protein